MLQREVLASAGNWRVPLGVCRSLRVIAETICLPPAAFSGYIWFYLGFPLCSESCLFCTLTLACCHKGPFVAGAASLSCKLPRGPAHHSPGRKHRAGRLVPGGVSTSPVPGLPQAGGNCRERRSCPFLRCQCGAGQSGQGRKCAGPMCVGRAGSSTPSVPHPKNSCEAEWSPPLPLHHQPPSCGNLDPRHER